MISGNSLHARKNDLGPALNNNPTSSDSGRWLGRTATHNPSPHEASPHHSPGTTCQPSAAVTKTRPATVEASPDNGMRLPMHKLVECQLSLNKGFSVVSNALQTMLLRSSMPRCPPSLRKGLDILKTKEPFDDKLFLELARLLRADSSVITGHQEVDKSVKIDVLEGLYHQLKSVPPVQQKQALSLRSHLETIKQNFERYAPEDRLCCLPDPVPEHEAAQMKGYMDALDTLLYDINKSAPGLLVKDDVSLQEKLSRAAEAVQTCKYILNRTNL